MKKVLLLFVAILLFSCDSQKKFTDFDISYSRSGGYAPIYENFLIKGTSAHYSFEGHGKKIKKDVKVMQEELNRIHSVLKTNNFRFIEADHLKIYDNITTTINVKSGEESGVKNDGSGIMEKDQKKWENITTVFRSIIDSKISDTQTK